MAVAFLGALWSASRRAPQDGIQADRILDLGPWLIIGGIIGARLLYVLTFWREQFAGKPFIELFTVWHGGLVFYGGFIGATAAAILFARIKKVPMWKMGDVLAPGIALGYAIGRLGCLLNGCCYGRECHLPWAIHFPPGHETYPHGVHPTQLYDAFLGLGFSVLLVRLFRHKKFDGQVFAVFLIGYCLLRSFVEIFRGDYPPNQRLFGGLITPAQVVSAAVLLAGVALYRMLPRPAAGNMPQAKSASEVARPPNVPRR